MRQAPQEIINRLNSLLEQIIDEAKKLAMLPDEYNIENVTDESKKENNTQEE